MISYSPLWQTLAEMGESTYTLIHKYGFNRRTIYMLRHNQSVTALTLEKLCLALNCPVQDIIYIGKEDPTPKADPPSP